MIHINRAYKLSIEIHSCVMQIPNSLSFIIYVESKNIYIKTDKIAMCNIFGKLLFS